MATLTQIAVPQDNDVAISLTVCEADGVTPQDCTGLTPVLYVKAGQNCDDGHAATLTPGAGLQWVQQGSGQLTAVLTHALLRTAGAQWWRLDLTDGSGNITTPMYGPLTITAC